MNPFVSRLSGNNWLIPITVMGLILGFLLQVTWITERTRTGRLQSLGSMDPDLARRLSAGSISLLTEHQKLTAEVATLREENTKLQNAMGQSTEQTKVLNESLQQTKDFAGLTEIEGPGIIITLRDAQGAQMDGVSQGNNIIHDIDVLKVVNELWAAGAEAIAVNGHRVVSHTSFRCVGPVIHVDNVPIASPVTIRAIGDPATLRGGMTLPLGVLAEIRSTGDPSMIGIDTVDKQTVPAYAGPSSRRYGRVPEPKKDEKK